MTTDVCIFICVYVLRLKFMFFRALLANILSYRLRRLSIIYDKSLKKHMKAKSTSTIFFLHYMTRFDSPNKTLHFGHNLDISVFPTRYSQCREWALWVFWYRLIFQTRGSFLLRSIQLRHGKWVKWIALFFTKVSSCSLPLMMCVSTLKDNWRNFC